MNSVDRYRWNILPTGELPSTPTRRRERLSACYSVYPKSVSWTDDIILPEDPINLYALAHGG